MELKNKLEAWKKDKEFAACLSSWSVQEEQAGCFVDFPAELHPLLADALRQNGAQQLYSHQLKAWQIARQGQNPVLASGTASGKSLAYNLPVLDTLLKQPESSALYLFPTKALTQDQLRVLQAYSSTPGLQSLAPAIYDGDSSAQNRPAIRAKARILLSNPDMLHQAILPHHTLWYRFLKGLRFVVIDEMHSYRGVFGSHFANLLRRLKRICAFYGSFPQFILSSATIGNPAELAEKLIGAPVHLLEEDSAPHGERHFLLYNPPLIDKDLGLRKSSLTASLNVTGELIENGHQTLLFAQSRRTVELMLSSLRNRLAPNERNLVRGYRSGYLAKDRREIESALKSGQARAILATSALELGIDIGDLDACLLLGYPGSITATRQRAGRAGRKGQPSVAILFAGPSAIDQYLASHPDYLQNGRPEDALIDPHHPGILIQHLRCALFELPFRSNEAFGESDPLLLQSLLQILCQGGEAQLRGDRYFYLGSQYPPAEVSLRSSSPGIISLHSMSDGQDHLIGQVDSASAPWMIHPEAVYLHDGESYLVESLDADKNLCTLSPFDGDYNTIALTETQIEHFQARESLETPAYSQNLGEIDLRFQVTGYRKIRLFTNEVVGVGSVDLPPTRLNTEGFWINIMPATVERLSAKGLWTASSNAYGAGWPALRQKILERDAYTCRGCGLVLPAESLHVHHVQPFKSFSSPEQANRPSNLVSLCPACHRRAEIAVRIRSGLAGAGYALGNLAPLLILIDREDIGVLCEASSVLNDGAPAILVYDKIPGGLGLSARLFERRAQWIEQTLELVRTCPCLDGCPACVGPIGEEGYGGKLEAIALLQELL